MDPWRNSTPRRDRRTIVPPPPDRFPLYGPIASTSKVPFSDDPLALSSWMVNSLDALPCDDCIPFTPFPCPETPTVVHRSAAFPLLGIGYSASVETSGLASYRFPHGLPTPASSRPNSPRTLTSTRPRRARTHSDEQSWGGVAGYETSSVEGVEFEPDDADADADEDEDEDEDEFRRSVMKRREFEREFDGDMEEWDYPDGDESETPSPILGTVEKLNESMLEANRAIEQVNAYNASTSEVTELWTSYMRNVAWNLQSTQTMQDPL
ncbi:hypothetical protein JCM11491_000204 [Sporobolomyces phaffii]